MTKNNKTLILRPVSRESTEDTGTFLVLLGLPEALAASVSTSSLIVDTGRYLSSIAVGSICGIYKEQLKSSASLGANR